MKNYFENLLIKNIDEELFPLLKCQSYNYNGKQQCAKLIMNYLKTLGLEVFLDTKKKNSVICARTNKSSKNNILIYSHFDVKPIGSKKLWNTEPFEPTIINNRIYCRGSGDAKCQIYSSIKAIELLQKEQKLSSTLGISLILEDSEESGSNNLEYFCKKHYDFLSPLFVIVLDSHWHNNQPLVGCGCRGQLSYLLEKKEDTFDNNLHAGNYGGIYSGAAYNLICCINDFINSEYIKKIYSNTRASFTIAGFKSGSLKRGIIPCKAQCNIDMRLDKQDIEEEKIYINKFFERRNIKVTYRQSSSPFISNINKNHLKILCNAIFKASGIKPTVFKQINAYLPLEKLSIFNKSIYVVPLAQSDENNHAPNENMKISQIIYGTKFVYNLYLDILGELL